MKSLSGQYPHKQLSCLLERSRSTLYYESGTGQRAQEDQMLRKRIEDIFHLHKSRYGSPRIWMQLCSEGIRCSEKRVARLMRQSQLHAIGSRRKAPRTTDSSHGGSIAPNRLRAMVIQRPNQAWVMDITYIRCGNDWVYLAIVLDLFLHKIVGWQVADHMRSSLAIDALQMAVRRQSYPKGVTLHSDRGTQYASHDFLNTVEALGYIRSMSAKGCCYDNAAAESLFGVIKREELDRWDLPDPTTVRHHVFEYIETYYNRVRIHTALGMSPEVFEQSFYKDEFLKASTAPQVEREKAGDDTHPRPRPVVAVSGYPSGGCSPAEPTSVSPDPLHIQQTTIELNNKKEYQNNR